MAERVLNTDNIRKIVINPSTGSAVVSIPKDLVILYKITGKDKIYFATDGSDKLIAEILRGGVVKT